MRYIAACIDQLDLAATQLHQDNPAYRRFALILTDNVVELMCYTRCKEEFRWDGQVGGSEKHSAQEKAQVLGNDFAAKVNFLRRLDVLTADTNDADRVHLREKRCRQTKVRRRTTQNLVALTKRRLKRIERDRTYNC